MDEDFFVRFWWLGRRFLVILESRHRTTNIDGIELLFARLIEFNEAIKTLVLD